MLSSISLFLAPQEIIQNIGRNGFGIISEVASKVSRIGVILPLTLTFAVVGGWVYYSKINGRLSKTVPDELSKTVPDELKGLLQKIQKLNKFEVTAARRGSGREIYIGSHAGLHKLFIKEPVEQIYRQPYAKQDQLAFMISHRLKLGVVPPTMACEGYKSILDRTSQVFKSRFPDLKGVVIQEGIEGIEGIESVEGVEHVIPSQFLANQKDNNICQAIIFNIIVGRMDGGPNNSIIDKDGKIHEFDNETIGAEKTDSWLSNEFPDVILNQQLIDHLLAVEDSLIENIFKNLECFPPTFFWNRETLAYDIVDKTKENIISNFNRLKRFLIDRQGKEIQIKDLKEFFY